ncbi:MAG: NAD(P)-dependent oxidoreductase [Oscillospiraceae bacterium]|jgi:UDP-glucose 4-epimerase|nr:NAD(P)-dependent oxidoreductase [Oscillospiraceae bacterium]
MKVFITGGTGCIGQYVTLAVAEKGHEAIVLSRTPDKYAPMSEMGNIKIVKGLMTDYELMAEYAKGCDAVISIALGWGNEPVSMLTNDTLATVNLLEISEKAGVGKFIFTSSTAAMGHNRPDMDEKYCNMPLNLYGSTKGAIEAYVLGFSQYFPEAGQEPKQVTMKRNVIRPGYTYATPCFAGGTTQLDSRFRDIADAVVNNKPVKITKHDGTQFLSAGQIAKAYVALLESDLNEEVFLTLAADYVTWARVAEMALEEYPDSSSKIDLEDKGWGSTPMLYNVDKMKRVFGLEFTGEDEIRAHVKWNLEIASKKAGK